MFWETISAALLLLSTFLLWLVVAIGWGALKAVSAFFSLVAERLSEDPIQWVEIWWIPVQSVFAGLEAAWRIPSSIWDWAKFEHPWWAFSISVATVLLLSYERR